MTVMPTRVAPMLAVSGEPFDSADFSFEIKWDGIRAIAYLDRPRFWMESRNFRPLLPRFPELKEIEASLRGEQLILDGEVIVLGSDHKPDFDTVRSRNAQKDPMRIAEASRVTPAVFVAFDCLFHNGESLMSLSLTARHSRLHDVVIPGERIVPTKTVPGAGKAYFDAVAEQGLEGVVGKRKESPYLPGERSSHWVKVRNVKTADCVVGGFSAGRERSLKSLLLGLYDDAGQLHYVGHVGTGWTAHQLDAIAREVGALAVETPAFHSIPRDVARSAHWVSPRIVCTVEYLTLTQNGHLRHAVFKSFRDDKPPRACLISTELGQVRSGPGVKGPVSIHV